MLSQPLLLYVIHSFEEDTILLLAIETINWLGHFDSANGIRPDQKYLQLVNVPSLQISKT